jgi:hypothetical protein
VSVSDDNGAEDGKAEIQLWICLDANDEGRAGKKKINKKNWET